MFLKQFKMSQPLAIPAFKQTIRLMEQYINKATYVLL